MAEEVTDLQLMQHQLNQQMLSEFSSLAHKHATVSYAVLAVLVLVLASVGVGGYFGLKAYQSALTHAEQVEQGYQSQLSQYQKQIAQDQAERADLERQIAARDKQATQKKKAVADITDPAKSIGALSEAYRGQDFQATITTEGKVAFPVPSVNMFTQTKISADAMAADINDLNDEVSSLKLDIANGQKTLAACQDTVGAYKKAAKKSKWQKIVTGAKIGGAILLSAAIGHMI